MYSRRVKTEPSLTVGLMHRRCPYGSSCSEDPLFLLGAVKIAGNQWLVKYYPVPVQLEKEEVLLTPSLQ
jgi:hypothetical protein